MKCIAPLTLPTKNGHDTVGCGKCMYCLRARKGDWHFRLSWELRESKSAIFVTLTYDQQHVPRSGDGKLKHQTLSKEDLINFHKSVRKANHRWFQDQGLEIPDHVMRYYSVGEYGTKTGRPHYHLLMFNVRPEIICRLKKIWGKGHIVVGEVNAKSIGYTAKYLIDRDTRFDNAPVQRPFSIMSKGLGQSYLRGNRDWHKSQDDEPEDWRYFVTTDQGNRQRLPRFYANQLFSDDERKYIGEMHQGEEQEVYLKALAKLEKLHPGEPMSEKRYWEKLRENERRIKTKSQGGNTL